MGDSSQAQAEAAMRAAAAGGALLGLVLLGAGGARAEGPPAPPREFRGLWVATVANIDWPSRQGLPAAKQQAELTALLDRARRLNFNAVILQVRPMCDALYESRLEPWSAYLSGRLGRPPRPAYDPLAFAVRAAHARGLELHAWFNPYRARHPSCPSPVPADHLIRSRPDLARPYGKHHWLIPTHPDVPRHTLAVILDVVRRYDVDGVHLDDYFYPYKEKDADGKVIPFPDEGGWKEYRRAGGKLPRDDWRRDAVNRFVASLYREVKKARPWVKVGISPFGIWRPGHPPGIAGLDQYAELYADAKKWFNEGWVDYLSPQLYWPIRQEKQSYPRLLDWWAGQNRRRRHLWPGLIPARVSGTARGWPAGEIVEQIKLTRKRKGATGTVHFSARAILRNSGGVADALARVYAEPALVPASPWLGKDRPARPELSWSADARGALRIRAAGAGVRLYVVRSKEGGKWTVTLVPFAGPQTRFAPPGRPGSVAVTAIDRAGLESEAATLADAAKPG
jgi:uncharacterized lipoprotein YddW (UPF0748 family)